MALFWSLLDDLNAVIWHDYVLYVVLAVGVLFTLWSRFGQVFAVTHGVQIVRGVYDDGRQPGAVSHFQALSTALSATVGLGNIAGVAIAISLGGPGAVFWMWVVGLVGMCLKMTEVTQAMLFRDTSDPEFPLGGPMWVCRNGFARLWPRMAPLGKALGALFCVTLLVSTITGGNMFQAWNVADISLTYFGVPRFVTGLILTVAVGLVIVGGIRRIGDVASRIVPFMCLAYLVAGFVVIGLNAAEIPGLIALIFKSAFAPGEAAGAFVGGGAGYAFLKGMQRALFSNEAGQGSAPIAHSAAKTDEPVSEGIVAGLEPFIDTLCVCSITALVILLSGSWNRSPALAFKGGDPPAATAVVDATGAQRRDERGRLLWTFEPVEIAVRDREEASRQLREDAELFLVVEVAGGGDEPSNASTGGDFHRVSGRLQRGDPADSERWIAVFDQPGGEVAAPAGLSPRVVGDGVYFDFKGATLTAKSFDRVLPGLGFWIVPAVAWLFAFSTIISWSYYGEQGMIFLFGRSSVMLYRVVYCALILVTTQLVRTQDQLDVLSTFGTGVMLWVNIPIMLLFGPFAMRSYHDYRRRLREGKIAPAVRRESSNG